MEEKNKAGHGGARPGAGRKPKSATGPAPRRQVTLDDETLAILRELGDGNVSEGIRVAARMAAEARKNGK